MFLPPEIPGYFFKFGKKGNPVPGIEFRLILAKVGHRPVAVPFDLEDPVFMVERFAMELSQHRMDERGKLLLSSERTGIMKWFGMLYAGFLPVFGLFFSSRNSVTADVEEVWSSAS